MAVPLESVVQIEGDVKARKAKAKASPVGPSVCPSTCVGVLAGS